MIRKCSVCQKEFTPKYNDLRLGRYQTCSKVCSNTSKKQARRYNKYTEEQIQYVIKLKKELYTNSEIEDITKVNLNTIKSVIKENKLFLTKEQAQKNCYTKKLEKNPQAMLEMRNIYKNQTTSEESLQDTIKYIEDRGYTYVSGFTQKTKSLTVKCNKCLKTKKISRVYTLIENSCINCLGDFKTSKEENNIKDFIESLGLTTEKYTIPKTHGREIDILISEKMIGIEYCGLYWHNENSPSPRDRLYHYQKMKQAEANSIRLITIFEDELNNRKSQIESFLTATLNKCKNRYYARKCHVEEIGTKEANKFLDTYHIQGAGKSTVAYGLYCNKELLGVITGSRHHRGTNNHIFVLNRLVFKRDCYVIGGSSKLLKNLINYCKENNYIKLISWSDNRWSEGQVYKKLNFILEEELHPDYSYITKSNIREPKQSNKKQDLLKKGAVGNTESEMAKSLGYKKIWDCGKKRWGMEIK